MDKKVKEYLPTSLFAILVDRTTPTIRNQLKAKKLKGKKVKGRYYVKTSELSKFPKKGFLKTFCEQLEEEPISYKEYKKLLKSTIDEISRSKGRLDPYVELPELYKKLKKKDKRVTLDSFKETLLRMTDDVLIDLHSVNDKSSLKEPKYAINTEFGDLYYVTWR